MKNIFLTFPDKMTADSILLKEENGETVSIFQNTDVIGIIYKPTGEQYKDSEGLCHDVLEDVGGWHVNLAAECCPEELKQYEVFPATPSRVFGGL